MGLEQNWNAGGQGSNFNWQLRMLQELGANNTVLTQILAVLGAAPGVDYELWVAGYKTNKVGTGYSSGDFVQRVIVINAATGSQTSTLWFNENLGSTIPAPPQSDLVVFSPTSAVSLLATSMVSGTSRFRSLTVNSTAQAVKAGAGNLYGWNITNLHSATIYVKIYNIAAASVNPASDIPIKTLMVPANGSVYQEPNCIQTSASSALSVRAVTDSGDTGTTAPTTLPIIEIEYV